MRMHVSSLPRSLDEQGGLMLLSKRVNLSPTNGTPGPFLRATTEMASRSYTTVAGEAKQWHVVNM